MDSDLTFILRCCADFLERKSQHKFASSVRAAIDIIGGAAKTRERSKAKDAKIKHLEERFAFFEESCNELGSLVESMKSQEEQYLRKTHEEIGRLKEENKKIKKQVDVLDRERLRAYSENMFLLYLHNVTVRTTIDSGGSLEDCVVNLADRVEELQKNMHEYLSKGSVEVVMTEEQAKEFKAKWKTKNEQG